ncbi:glutamate receptor 2.7-like isoform X4 [Cucurbita moschata]|uniref:Glutamate receptor n=1 Tax=Cucurbita moschata TaxID=3662 RepID=A0A6J1HCW7_CUCMO|nr:glutamate receptor 2.7-like isoform X4 [Cucurbita moschata]
MFPSLYFFCLVGFLVLDGLCSTPQTNETHLRCSGDHPKRAVKMGVIADNSSRVGREQIVAIHMAFKQYPLFSNSCHKVEFLLEDSPDNSTQAVATALNLITHKRVKAMIGTLTREEVSSIFELHKASKNIPIISLSSASIVPPPTKQPIQTSSFIQMGNDITHQLQCIAAIVGKFQWQRVTALYEQRNNDFTTNLAILKLLSDSLRDANSEIENHIAFSLSDPKLLIEEKLMNLSSNSNRVFILVQSSMELATLLFKKATKLNMMTNGYVWIVADEMANLLDSLDSSVFHNLQGVIGCKINYGERRRSFKKFKTQFRRDYLSEFPEEEGQGEPSIFALRAYDAYWAIASTMDKLQGNEWAQKVVESKFEGVSGVVSFKNGILSQLPIFQIINVVGKSYREIAYWSPEFGFCDKLPQQTRAGNVTIDSWGLVVWPGNGRRVPRGWDFRYGKKVLKLGVPTTATFLDMVHVNYNHTDGAPPHIAGYSISVFKAVAHNLPYFLPYELVPYNGTYDSLMQKVEKKEFDGAIGDFGIVAHRLQYVEFSEPYLENAVVMIVKEKPLEWTQLWLFMKAFNAQMWLIMLSMHIFVSSVIWLIEREHNDALRGFGNMLWFSVSVLFYAHGEPIKSGLARLVLGPWLFAILIITSSFTASLSSMMTITMSKPPVYDIESLKLKNATVGCTQNSIVMRFLSQASIPPENVKQLPSVDLFPIALETGEIQAALLTAPHARIFLAKYCKGLTKLTLFNLVGMGFAFPKGSPLTLDISLSIAELIERREMPDFEATLLSTFNCSNHKSLDGGSGLGPGPFAGLFLFSGVIASIAVLFTATHLALMKLRWIQNPFSTKNPFSAKNPFSTKTHFPNWFAFKHSSSSILQPMK